MNAAREIERLGKVVASMHHDDLVDYIAGLLRENLRLRVEKDQLHDAQLRMIKGLATT